MTVTPQTTIPLARVRELPAGDKVTGFYLLAKLETRPKKDGTSFLACHLQDSTGSLDAKMWEKFEEFLPTAKVGDVVKVEAVMDRYRDLPGLVISRIRLATEEEIPDRRQYLPHSPLSAAEASAKLEEWIASIAHESLKNLLNSIFGDENFRRSFLEAPGGKLWHHAALGGLAEHTLSLANLADSICANYPFLNRDLLLTGALLHDCGKVMEFSTEVTIDYSVEGRLLGHIVQGTLFIEKHLSTLENFPAETRRQVLHLVLSHQGDGTMGSPVKPMTAEALALHFLDELDSKMEAFQRVRRNTPEEQDFSAYVNLMERFFYFKPVENPGTQETENE